jgi:hypothetical protein
MERVVLPGAGPKTVQSLKGTIARLQTELEDSRACSQVAHYRALQQARISRIKAYCFSHIRATCCAHFTVCCLPQPTFLRISYMMRALSVHASMSLQQMFHHFN